MEKELSLFTGDHTIQKELFLKMYANPVLNAGISGVPPLLQM
jgi:hypothetical protein